MKTFSEFLSYLREDALKANDLKIGDKVGSKMHRNDKATYFHGTVTKIEPHPIYGHAVHYQTGTDKYGAVTHMSPISHIVKESEPATYITNQGTHLSAMKHYDNHEMSNFLKSSEGAGHQFIGLDNSGKPHTAIIQSNLSGV